MVSAGTPLAIFAGVPGWAELLVVATVGLLIFGRRLPEVGRSLGKGIVEFKRGIRGINDDIEDESSRSQQRIEDQTDKTEIPQAKVGEESGNPYQPAEPARDS